MPQTTLRQIFMPEKPKEVEGSMMFRVEGSGSRGLGFRGLGFRGLGFRGW